MKKPLAVMLQTKPLSLNPICVSLAKIKNADARILKEFHTAAMDLKKLGAKQSIIDDMIERYHAASIKILDNAVKTKEELGY